jgi:hypothetical protein
MPGLPSRLDRPDMVEPGPNSGSDAGSACTSVHEGTNFEKSAARWAKPGAGAQGGRAPDGKVQRVTF